MNKISIRAMWSHRAINLTMCAIFGTVVSLTASAQDASDSLEEIVVTGFKASITAARDAKMQSESISDSIVAEDIGKSTDENIAEALNRITGVTIQSSDGIGSTVTIRGLDPNLNLISLNGVVLGSADDGRAVDLSAYSADMLSQIEVVKSADASQNEGSLGGSINLTTARPLSRPYERIAGELQWRSTDFDRENDYKASAGISQKFADDRFGLAATIIQDNQFRRSDRFETFNWRVERYLDPISLQSGQTLPGVVWGAAPRFSSQRIDGLDRKNLTANVVLQARPTDTADIFLDLSYSQLDIVTDRYMFQTKNWFSNNPSNANSGPGRAIAGTAIYDEDNQTYLFTHSQRVQGFMQTRHIEEDREQLTAILGGSFDFGPLQVDAKLSHMDLDQDIPIWHQVNFQGVSGSTPTSPPVGFSCGIEIDPATNIPTPGGTQFGSNDRCAILFGGWFNPLDPDYAANVGPRMNQARINGRQVKGEATSFFLDFEYELENFTLAFGGKYSDQKKDRFQQDSGINVQTGVENPAGVVTIGQMSNPFPFSDGYLGDQIAPSQATSWIVPDLASAFQLLWPSGVPGTTPNAIQSWDVSEEATALYLMAKFGNNAGTLSGNVGVRYVGTQVDANGTFGYTFRTQRPTYMDLQDSDCSSISGNVCFVELPSSDSNSYDEFLPSLNLNYLLKDDMMLRFSVSRTMARPTFNDVRPSSNVNVPSSSGGAAPTFSSGNTQLEPLISNTIDVSWEWYFGESSLLSTAIFFKDMEDFVFTGTTLQQYRNPVAPKPGEDRSLCPGQFLCDETLGVDPVTGEFPVANIVSTGPINGAAAEIFGIELTYQHSFDSLPGFWGGFGTLVNYTYADSEADYTEAEGADDPYQGFPFLNTSEHSVNATLFWENDRTSVRLAYNWRDEYLVNPVDLQMSTWSEAVSSLDASFTFNLTDRVSLTGNAVNLTDESTRWYQTIAFVNANQPGVLPEGNALSGNAYDSRTRDVNYFGRTYRLGLRVTF